MSRTRKRSPRASPAPAPTAEAGQLLLCKEGYEAVLTRELAGLDCALVERGGGWLRVTDGRLGAADAAAGLCFATHQLRGPQEVRASSTKQLAASLADLFVQLLGEREATAGWPLAFLSAPKPGLTSHAKLVETRWRELARKRRARVLRRAGEDLPEGSADPWGFFVVLVEKGRAFACPSARSFGQRRMRMDPRAPSRSFLKLEEVFALLGVSPEPDDLVVDLGAAPGGWSYSAARRGARVLAVDNGPLKGGAREDRRIQHLRSNAFTFAPPDRERADWLLCDMIEDPEQVMELVATWLQRGWCRRFVANLKFGRHDPLRLLSRLRDPEQGLAHLSEGLLARQLYHDRDELTVMGERKN